MADLLEIEDRSERIARRALYRSCFRLGETVSTSPSASCRPS